MNRQQSEALFEQAKTLFPGGVHSPVRAFKSVKGAPLFIRRGHGCWIEDEDGNTFIDFCCSWGPLILGHCHPQVMETLTETINRGTSFGAPSRLGNSIGLLLQEHHNYFDKIRFVSSGTEAVMSAIRLARGVTGKSKILKFEGCYHGHVDPLLVKAGSGLVTFGISSSAGVPDSVARDTLVVPLGDPKLVELICEEHRHDLACIIIEPVPANNGLLLQDPGYLRALREICTRYGILLIFDEVISGFRISFEGAAGYYGIKPDLVTYGKIIGGGLPVGAFAGPSHIMDNVAPLGPVYQAGTLSANPVAMAAGLATLSILKDKVIYDNLDSKTANFVGQLQAHCAEKGYPVTIQRIGSIFWIAFSEEAVFRADQISPESMDQFKILHAYLLENGVYFGPSGYEVGFVSTAHNSEVLDQAAQIINAGFDQVFA